MANVEIPKQLMLKKLNKNNGWHQLGLNDWHNQIGLINAMNKKNGMG